MYAKAFATAVLFGAANAHLFISQPVPIPGSNDKAPLDPSGSNFPCQGADLTGGQVTNMAVGSSQPLKFDIGANGENWAVHGGGSCQISVTYETDKAKQKDPNNWKVIHSFIGGCPTNAKLNLDPKAVECNGSNGPQCVINSYTFQIPAEVKNGNAILAWTWFNNIGNREMYMNCAKVSFSGGSDNVASLPSLFAANIGNGCGTTEGTNLDIPNPGKYVTKGELNYPLKAPTGSCPSGPGSGTAANSGSSSGTGTGSGTGSTTTPAASAPSPATSGTKGGKGGKGGQGGAFAEGASSPTTLATVPQAAPTAASAPAPAAGSGSCSNGAVACTATGFYCIDQGSFGLCDRGCAIPMKMAAGTMCSGGAVARIVNRHIHHRRHFMGVSL